MTAQKLQKSSKNLLFLNGETRKSIIMPHLKEKEIVTLQLYFTNLALNVTS